MKIFEPLEDQSGDLPPSGERLAWHSPILTVASVGEKTRNDVNQLPYDMTNVRS